MRGAEARVDALEILWRTVCAGCDEPGVGRLCASCREGLAVRAAQADVPGIRGILGAAPYDGPIGVALQRAKYGRDRGLMVHLARGFSDLLAPWVVGGAFAAIVDVPSPWPRRMTRGFATGAVLAAALGRRTGLPVLHALRIRHGRRNAGLTASGRRANLARRVRSDCPVPGRVLLVDDVVTTGATAEACARELLGTASREIWLATLCVADARPPARVP